jgi:hypothetical protein
MLSSFIMYSQQIHYRIIKNPLSGGNSSKENQSKNEKPKSDSIKSKTKKNSKNELKNDIKDKDTTN